jgi:hypothetical protein
MSGYGGCHIREGASAAPTRAQTLSEQFKREYDFPMAWF